MSKDQLPPGYLDAAVSFILSNSPTSSTEWRSVFQSAFIPESVSGLRMLDVGAGGSDATVQLREMGAEAFALDPRYKNMDQAYQDLKDQNDRTVWEDPAYKREDEEALERFIASAREFPERFVAASATDIPFPDEHFDIVFSRGSLADHLSVDWTAYSTAILECMRVLKKGGSLRLFAYMQEDSGYNAQTNQVRLRNQRLMSEQLRENPGVVTVKVEDVGGYSALVVEKAR